MDDSMPTCCRWNKTQCVWCLYAWRELSGEEKSGRHSVQELFRTGCVRNNNPRFTMEDKHMCLLLTITTMKIIYVQLSPLCSFARSPDTNLTLRSESVMEGAGWPHIATDLPVGRQVLERNNVNELCYADCVFWLYAVDYMFLIVIVFMLFGKDMTDCGQQLPASTRIYYVVCVKHSVCNTHVELLDHGSETHFTIYEEDTYDIRHNANDTRIRSTCNTTYNHTANRV